MPSDPGTATAVVVDTAMISLWAWGGKPSRSPRLARPLAVEGMDMVCGCCGCGKHDGTSAQRDRSERLTEVELSETGIDAVAVGVVTVLPSDAPGQPDPLTFGLSAVTVPSERGTRTSR